MHRATGVKKKSSTAPSGAVRRTDTGRGRGNASDMRPTTSTRINSGVGRGRVKKRPPSSGPIYQTQLKECPPADRPNLMIQKLKFCMKCYDFTDNEQMEDRAVRDGKKIKQMILMEICDYINTKPQILTHESVVSHLIEMVCANLFNGVRHFTQAEPSEDEEPLLDPAYVHTQLVYEILLRFVMNGETESGTMRRYVNLEFIDKLLSAFDTEDPREREYLKTILHRIYGRFMTFRLAIRKSINHIFYEFTYEDAKHAGIGELLEILGSIINGFALPLKEEHKTFMRKYLLPLYKPRAMLNYHPQLCYCIVQFVEKDPSLAANILGSLLKWWPHSNSQKEVSFLNEIEEVVEITHNPEEHLASVVRPLFKRIAMCISSDNFQVAERALFLWQARHVMDFCRDCLQICLPILYPALCPEKEHWNQSVQQLSAGVLEWFKQLDSAFVEQVESTVAADRAKKKQEQESRAARWRKIEEVASNKKRSTPSQLNPGGAVGSSGKSEE